MAASDGNQAVLELLLKRPELVVFDYLTRSVFGRNTSSKRQCSFPGKNSYNHVMQALMMDGVKGTALISYLERFTRLPLTLRPR